MIARGWAWAILALLVSVVQGLTSPAAAATRAVVWSTAVAVLEEHKRLGLPLDAVLRRQFQGLGKGGIEYREDVSDLVFSVARHQARLDWRLAATGVPCNPTNRLVANMALAGQLDGRMRAAFPWLEAWSASSMLESSDMDVQHRLECPDWAWQGFQDAFGDSLENELRALQVAPPLDLRVNTLKATREEALASIRAAGFDKAKATPFAPQGIRIPDRVPLGSVPGLLEGIVEPMDEGSQLIASMVEARPGEAVVDFCAGSGGKTLALAACMENKGRSIIATALDDVLDHACPLGRM